MEKYLEKLLLQIRCKKARPYIAEEIRGHIESQIEDNIADGMSYEEEKDMYGYEMIDTLRKKSCNVFELKAGTLYPLLHGLEGKGLLKVYEQEYVGKTRKYYSITKEGRALLETKKAEWSEYQSAVANVLAMGV